jgi:excisionase family DNA binding protein
MTKNPARQPEPPEKSRPVSVQFTNTQLVVTLHDGRTIGTPLEWYLTLSHATAEQRANYELMIDGIHWPDLDEDLSIDGMLMGRRPRWPATVDEWQRHLAELREHAEEVMTVQEVAQAFGKSRYTVHAAIRRRRLPARKSGSTWLIRRQDAEAYWKS